MISFIAYMYATCVTFNNKGTKSKSYKKDNNGE